MRAWRAIGNITRLNEQQGKKNKDRPCRVYACPYGNGYHLTSKYEDWKP